MTYIKYFNSSQLVEMKSFSLIKRSLKILQIILLFCFYDITYSQVTFEKFYGGISDEEGNSIVQTGDGGFIIAGYTKSFGAGNRDLYIIRIKPDGDTLWTRTFGGINYDEAYDITRADGSNYLIGGYTVNYGIGEGDIYLIKIDDNGDTLWTKTIGTVENDHIKKIRKTSDGGYIICGDIEEGGSYKYFIAKTNSTGDTLWTKSYNSGIAYSIDQTNDGGYILVVLPFEVPDWKYDFLLVKTDQNGNILWTKTFGGPEVEVCYAVEQTTDGGYILAGRTDSYGAGGSDFYLLKTNSSGDSLWSGIFGGSLDERAFAAMETSDGGYLIAGYTSTFGAGYFDFYIVKTGSNGNLLWTRTYGGVWQEMAYEVKESDDGGYVIIGYTQSFGQGGFDIYLVKTDQYGLVTGIVDDKSDVVADFRLYQNFPDPFNPSTTIKFETSVDGYVTLKVYDILGREVATIINNYLSAGTREVVFDASTFSGGVYFYQLNAENSIETKKMLFLR